MFCQRCGAKLPENTTKCPNCGAEYVAESATDPETNEKTPKKISFFTKKKIIITLLIVAILIFGGITAAVTLSNGSSISVSTSDMLQLADRYLKEMNYEQAIIEFQKILEIEPKNVDAYIGLAEAYVALGDNDRAIEVLEQGRRNVDNEQRIENKLAEINGIVDVEQGANVSETETVNTTTEMTVATEAATTTPTTTAETTIATEAMTTTEAVEEPVFGSMGSVVILGEEYDIATTTKLYLYSSGVTNEELKKIAQLTNLTMLWLYDNQISDITPLAQLTNLAELQLTYNQICDITPLAKLTNLTKLQLDDNQIGDITPLTKLTNLTKLNLRSNQISDITPLAQLTNLTKLNLGSNQISDITPLAQLTNLTELTLYDNQISDITPLAQLTNLTVLDLEDNQISESQIQQLISQLPDCHIDY